MSSIEQAAPPAPSADSIPVLNPITQDVIGHVPLMDAAAVTATVQRARSAAYLWGARSVRSRTALLARFRDLVWTRQRELMDHIRAETGKTDGGAFLEVIMLDTTLTWLIHNAERVLRPKRRQVLFPFLESGRVYYKPHGVAGFISPWNYPVGLPFIDALPALAAGNTVVIKPSELTPLCVLFTHQLMLEAGFPDDVVQIVTGDGSTGAALVEQVDYIGFTGSTPVGRKVAVQAAERLIPYSLELGGKDAMIVLKDADLDLAAAGTLAGGFENAGQMCISVERVYVEQAIYDDYLSRVSHYAQTLVLGAGGGYDVHVGSLTNERELLRVEAQVQDALDKGARLLYGGKRRPDLGPLFYEPAILADCTPDMRVMQEESFGPVVPIMPVPNADAAVLQANSSEYGLSGAVYTRDLAKGEHIAFMMDSGDTVVNRSGVVAVSPDMPWGGQKHSGVGRRGGPEGLLRFVSTKSIIVDRRWDRSDSVVPIDATTLPLYTVLRTLRRFLPFL